MHAPAGAPPGQAWSNPVAPSPLATGPSAAPLPASAPQRPILAAAPAAATPLLQADPNPRTVTSTIPSRRSSSKASIVTTVGFGISAIVGLAIGYYVLCYVNPKGNFLHLSPNWFPWKVEAEGSEPLQ